MSDTKHCLITCEVLQSVAVVLSLVADGAMARQCQTSFEEMGYEVRISDLYTKKFEAVLDRHDFIEIHDEDMFKPNREQGQDGNLAADIVAEQELITWADVVIFQFPVWWVSVPSILKGYFDRVLSVNFAYGFRGGMHVYRTGLLKGKKTFLSMTAGGTTKNGMYGLDPPGGLQGDFDILFFPVEHGTLFFSGFEVVKRFIAEGPEYTDADARAAMLVELDAHCKAIDSLPKIDFPTGIKQE